MADNAPVIVKRVKKVAGGGHHGGAWKVAYADFVTAMMAFFLLLWLLNAVTEEQLVGISNYFAPQTTSRDTTGAGGILGGQVLGQGAQTSQSSSPNVTYMLPPPVLGKGEAQEDKESDEQRLQAAQQLSDKDVADLKAQQEQKAFDQAQEQLRQAIQTSPEFRQLKDSLVLDNTPEGLRIQLVDNERLAMFPSGSADPYLHTRKLIELISKVVMQMPQKVAITGHTDAVPYTNPQGNYGNWELSADRALAARRSLLQFGLTPDRIMRVVGKAETEPLIRDDPRSARNRRIAIVLLREFEGGQTKTEAVPTAPPKP